MEDYLGMIKIFSGSFAPNGWMFCQGQLLNIRQYQALYSIISNQYGGDGVTTFALPDLRSRFPMGMGNGPGLSNVAFAQKGGAVSAAFSENNIPPHTHGVTGSVQLMVMNQPANTDSPAGNYLSIPNFAAFASSPGLDNAANLQVNLDSGVNGGSSGFSIMPPSIGANFIICCTMGIYPQRPNP